MLNTNLQVTCSVCRNEKIIKINQSDLESYQNGSNAQHAFPYLSAADRELIISNICGPCFGSMFADEA